MAEVFGRQKKPRRYRIPILFAGWTGWLFWLGVLAVFGWWLIVLTATTGSDGDQAAKTSRPEPPRLIEYSIAASPFAVDAYRVPVSILFPASELVKNSRICRQARTEDHFVSLLRTFAQEDGWVYSFRYLGEVSDNGILPVVVVPNAPRYKDLAAFKKDFNVCVAGGRYPHEVTDDWLLFVEGCPRADDRSDGVAGCGLIRTELLKTLKIVE